MNKDELMEMARYADNSQDGAILALLVEGVSLEEMLELSKFDVDFLNRTVQLKDKKLQVSSSTILIVKGAVDQDAYITITGEHSKIQKLEEDNSVFRPLKGEQMNVDTLKDRIRSVEEKDGYQEGEILLWTAQNKRKD
ncbi:hypothetical protein [Peribacillus asahii]|uniref:hypothetical protein n=1 Tax=Peribacillus asahii TaxID=228899 RepID=UPI0037FD5528